MASACFRIIGHEAVENHKQLRHSFVVSIDVQVIVLDEKGKQLTSEGLAQFIQKRSNESVKNIVFLIGGAFGLEQLLIDKAKFNWSLSHLTFPHQLVRLILAEQIYRACTILRNEKYHHK